MSRLLRGLSLVVTDRRWMAPLSAAALGFGLFIGVAIGPGTAGSLATGAQQIVAIPGPGAGAEAVADVASSRSGEGGAAARVSHGDADPSSAGGSLISSLPAPVPLAPEASEPAPAPVGPEAPPAEPAAEEEAEEAEEGGETLAGTVVHVNPAAGSYALAISGGELVAVHAPKLPAPGTKLKVPLRRLANGTFAEEGPREPAGTAVGASFEGVVTFVDATPTAPAYTVSGRGASVLVRVQPDPTGALPPLPALGSYATVTVSLEKAVQPTALWQLQVKADGAPSTYLELAGTVDAIYPETKQLLFSADDSGESGKALTLTIPDQLDTSLLEVGDSYLATATIEADASLVLAGLVSDEHGKGADDPKTAQGDLKR